LAAHRQCLVEDERCFAASVRGHENHHKDVAIPTAHAASQIGDVVSNLTGGKGRTDLRLDHDAW
jgi:hypothetical protein